MISTSRSQLRSSLLTITLITGAAALSVACGDDSPAASASASGGAANGGKTGTGGTTTGAGGASNGGKVGTGGATASGGTGTSGSGGSSGAGSGGTAPDSDAGSGGTAPEGGDVPDASLSPDGGTEPDANPPVDAGMCSLTPGSGGASCNAVVNTGTNVTITAGTGTLGSGTGGTVINGTYHLSEVLVFTGSSLPNGVLIRQTLEVCNGQVELSENIADFATSNHKSFTFGPASTVPNLNMICSTKSNDPNIVYTSFTATPTGFTLYNATDSFQMSFTKT